jgi:uncharacterized membrane protein
VHPPATSVEDTLIVIVQWLKLAIETVGVALVAIGVIAAVMQLIRTLTARQPADFTDIRLTLARYLALALEFELGADILGTAVSPNWDQIGKLGAVAVIRTGLNFFLSMEMKQEKPTGKSQAANDDSGSRDSLATITPEPDGKHS